MRNGHISLGVFLIFMAGLVLGNLEWDESWWIIAVTFAIVLMVHFAGFERIDRGVKEEVEKGRQALINEAKDQVRKGL